MSCLLDLDKYLHKRSLSILVSDSSVALQALEVHQDTTEAIDQWQFACWFTITGSHVLRVYKLSARAQSHVMAC